MHHLIQTLEEEFHGHKKAIEDNPETEHTRILYLRRIESLRLFVQEHFSDSYKKYANAQRANCMTFAKKVSNT